MERRIAMVVVPTPREAEPGPGPGDRSLRGTQTGPELGVCRVRSAWHDRASEVMHVNSSTRSFEMIRIEIV